MVSKEDLFKLLKSVVVPFRHIDRVGITVISFMVSRFSLHRATESGYFPLVLFRWWGISVWKE